MDFHQVNLLCRYAREYGHSRIRDAGVSDTEHQICAFLYAHEELSQDDVAGALLLDKTTVAKALHSLESRRLITRRPNPENRRKNLLYLTEAGKTAIADVVHVYDEWLARISACLTPREQQLFDEYVQRLLTASKNMIQEDIQP
ncbi:MAG: MarR family transcriptional regulator [Eubacteriales bacterium]|nr:MarR family transcriptional regulator [Eubacteriales bacterium]